MTIQLEDLKKRLDWFDEERRKNLKKLTDLEQKLILKDREIDDRDQRLADLERKVSNLSAQQARQLQIDTELAQFKDDIVSMIEQYDKRRIQSEEELDRLRRLEQETTVRELAAIRKELPALPRLRSDIEMRQAEEVRLANLITEQESKIDAIRREIEPIGSQISFIDERERQSNRQIAEIRTDLLEATKRINPLHERLDLLNNQVLRYENSIRDLTKEQEEVRTRMKGWLEQIQLGEYERNKQMETWRELISEQEDLRRSFSREWIPLQDQYKETRMMLQTIQEWRNQQEQAQREMSELLRVETQRMQARWDNFRQEQEKQWRTLKVENEQQWSAEYRTDRQVQEQLASIEETLVELENEKNTLQRIQTAQSDALKKFPRVWLEEVEKAIANDPNRRRQPAPVTVREE